MNPVEFLTPFAGGTHRAFCDVCDQRHTKHTSKRSAAEGTNSGVATACFLCVGLLPTNPRHTMHAVATKEDLRFVGRSKAHGWEWANRGDPCEVEFPGCGGGGDGRYSKWQMANFRLPIQRSGARYWGDLKTQIWDDRPERKGSSPGPAPLQPQVAAVRTLGPQLGERCQDSQNRGRRIHRGSCNVGNSRRHGRQTAGLMSRC